MSAQLDQVLGYLDREGVTEMVLAVGRPITLLRAGVVVPVTNAAVSRGQLMTLLAGSPIAKLLPEADGSRPPIDVDTGKRRIRVHVSRRGDEYTIRIERAPAVTEVEINLDEPTALPFASITRTKAASIAPPTRAHRKSIAPPSGIAFRTTAIPTVTPVATPSSMEFRTAPIPTVKPMTLDLELELEPQVAPPPPVRTRGSTRAPRATRSPPLRSMGPATFADLVQLAQDRGASDLHIATGRATAIRVLGELVPIDPAEGPASEDHVRSLLGPLIEPHQAKFDEVGYIDLAIESPRGGRLRSNLSRHQGGLKGTFRIARTTPPTIEELGLPRELAKVIAHHQGLVVIAGPSGHGKTTTLAALVDLINAARPFHIITIEDPVEIVYPRKAAVVSQREVGPHTRSFAAALKGSLREDPDVIVIGELRDRETVEIALTAAETGHLVIATMSTPSAAKTIDRLVDMFPPDDQTQVRASIAGALRAIVSQRLLPSANGKSVVAAVELLTGCLPLSQMIRDDKLFQLPNLMQRGRSFGMMRFDDSLTELVKSGQITADAAIAASENKRELATTLRSGGKKGIS